MPKMACGNCGYTRNLSEKEAEFGMLCPKCHCQYLRKPLRSRRPGEARSARPVSIRLLIGGGVLFFVGFLLVAFNLRSVFGPGRGLGERFFAYGIVLTIGGLISLIAGGVSLFRDLTQD